jgi:hypothetical protein
MARMKLHLTRITLFCAIAAVLLGCPPDDKKAPAPTPSGACEKVGQSCEYSPGKLGTCVQKDDCKSAPCFVCQSQH